MTHTLIQAAAADLHLFMQQHYSNLHCNITFSNTATLHLFTQQYYVHKLTQQHHTYVHSSIHLIIGYTAALHLNTAAFN